MDEIEKALEFLERRKGPIPHEVHAAIQTVCAALRASPAAAGVQAAARNPHKGGSAAYLATEHFNEGWNACREAMMKAAEQWAVPCCVCKAPVDTRENGTPGAELTDGRWVCSTGCWESEIEREIEQPAVPEDVRRDAERYRRLRRKVCIVGSRFHVLNLNPTYVAPDSAAELDACLDAAAQPRIQQGGPTE